jgi:hypothetical protein
MLNALSRAPKRPSDDQSSSARPMRPIAVERSWISFTARTIVETSLSGNIRDSSRTRYVDSSARPNRPSSETVRNVSGTNARSA